ncbi:MAG: hypothetical protein H0U85_02510 [Gemmatimonadales bacterium]|nr:hypothetical protein [Gemmatimonadales bacterium]
MTTPTPSPEKRALIDAYDTVMQVDAERRDAETSPVAARRRWTGTVIWALFALTLLGCAAIAVLRPDWLRIRRELAVPPVVQQANLRLAMGLQIERIARYERAHAALPDALADAGPVVPGVTYRRVGSNGYELTGTDGRLTLTYASGTPVRTFVGDAYNVLVSRSRQ